MGAVWREKRQRETEMGLALLCLCVVLGHRHYRIQSSRLQIGVLSEPEHLGGSVSGVSALTVSTVLLLFCQQKLECDLYDLSPYFFLSAFFKKKNVNPWFLFASSEIEILLLPAHQVPLADVALPVFPLHMRGDIFWLVGSIG